MNRSILIVICDFLLVSLLAFSTVDINRMADPGAQRTIKMDLTSTPQETGKDLTAAMRVALDEERKSREQLQAELAKTQESASEREKQVQLFQQQLQSREQQALRLQQEQGTLQQQLISAQSSLQALNQQLLTNTTDAVLSKDKLAAMEAEAKKQSEQAAALKQQLAQLAQSNQMVLGEKQQLATQLQVAQAEKRAATEQIAMISEQVKAERAEKAKLAEGVKALASKSDQLQQEIRENRPLAPNTIFNEFLTNRVQAHFTAVRAGVFGDATKNRDAALVLVTDGTNIFALCHVQDTPLALWDPGTDWSALLGTLAHNGATVPIRSLSFSLEDPRLVWMPVTAAEARQLGSKVYRISNDPFKFQDAVLVGTQDSYYGQCSFEIDTTTPDYVKLDRSLLKGLFGKFNPSRGDLVFSKTGELLGVMANGTYCLMVRRFESGAVFQFGGDTRGQHTGIILSQLYSQVSQLPFKLQ